LTSSLTEERIEDSREEPIEDCDTNIWAEDEETYRQAVLQDDPDLGRDRAEELMLLLQNNLPYSQECIDFILKQRTLDEDLGDTVNYVDLPSTRLLKHYTRGLV
jgi:hypothetical protein